MPVRKSPKSNGRYPREGREYELLPGAGEGPKALGLDENAKSVPDRRDVSHAGVDFAFSSKPKAFGPSPAPGRSSYSLPSLDSGHWISATYERASLDSKFRPEESLELRQEFLEWIPGLDLNHQIVSSTVSDLQP